MAVRPMALACAGLLATWACLWGVAPFADHMVRGASPVVAEAGFGVIVFGAILLLALGLGRVAGLPKRLPDWAGVAGFGRGAVVGAAALVLAIGYCALAGTLGWGGGEAARAALPLGLLTVLLQVTAEEVMFRGHVQPLLVRAMGPGMAVPLTAVSFAALHAVLAGAAPVMLANMLLGGVLFGVLALHRGLGAAIGAHFAWNAIEQLGVGIDPNPGVGAFGSVIDIDLSGAALWGGSGAGLNASIAMGAALLATILLVVWRRPA